MPLVFYHALEVFGFCLAVHVIVWRALPVQHQGARLGLIFVILPLFLFVIAFLLSRQAVVLLRDIQWVKWMLAYLLHFSLAGSYLFFYTAVTGFSPSIAILEKVEESMPKGLKRLDLAPSWFSDKHLSGVRRANLLATGFIVELDGLLRLSRRGWIIARVFLIFRRFLGLPDVARG